MTQQRIKFQDDHKTFHEMCKSLFKTDRLSQRCSQSTVSVTFTNIVNSSNDKLPGQRIFGPMNVNEQNIGISYRYNKYNEDSCAAMANDELSNENDGSDQRTSESLTKRDLRLKCEMFVHGDEENFNFFVDTVMQV